MKKENVLRKILVSSLIGFPVGITLLMIAYIGVYYIAGVNIFRTEINQLQNIQTLISQFIILGLSYYMVFIDLHVALHLSNKESTEKNMTKHPYTIISISLLSSLSFITATILIGIKNIFSKNIATMNIIILLLFTTIYGVFFMVKSTIESNLVKKINAKIKERNK